jgi:hypothetical protein
MAIDLRTGPVVEPTHGRERHGVIVHFVWEGALGDQETVAQVEGLAIAGAGREFKEERAHDGQPGAAHFLGDDGKHSFVWRVAEL